MKVIVAGSRNITSLGAVYHAIKGAEKEGITITEVVSGCARGVDTIGELWADFKQLKLTKFPADWDKHGRSAGPIRNQEMADYADALIVVWDGKSSGSKNMLETMKKTGKPYFSYVVEEIY